jgi:hypothetical protein
MEKNIMAVEKIVAIFDASDQTAHQYDQLIKELEEAGAGKPEGRMYHVAYSKGGGYLVVDVWESAELFEQFSQTLVSIIQKLGLKPAPPQIYPVHNIIKG